MNLRSRATLALPLVILLAGFLVPLLMDAGPKAAGEEDTAPGIHAGRTAIEWEGMAVSALVHGAHSRALSCAKSAELADHGEQYGDLIREIRRSRRRSREIAGNAERFLGRPVAHVEHNENGGVIEGVRVVVALPGESLWTLAVAYVAAENDVLPGEVDVGTADVYAAWDRLTAANGVRELEVGETVFVPLTSEEAAVFTEVNRQDMESLDDALRTARAGDIEGAREMLAGVTGRFALASEARAEVELALVVAGDERRAMREQGLIVRAHELVDGSRSMSRIASHTELLAALREAAACLDEAEGLYHEERYAQPRAAVGQMLGEVERFRFAPDGSVTVPKPAGVAYTDAAMEAVEWLLARELVWSGETFPRSDAKSADEFAWARYLVDAAKLARKNGVDVERLIADRDTGTEIVLPNPEEYFAQGT
ncbi:hypothetical protein K8S17_02580 [bacterium]|nr:hypothetical protein [bacterium]